MKKTECFSYLGCLQSPLLLFGHGQLGTVFSRLIDDNVTTVKVNSVSYFMRPEELMRLVISVKPKIIINTAAYTSVEMAEQEPTLAFMANENAVAILAEAAKLVGALFVHFSTDYVFDGSGDQAWKETDIPAPLNIYGKSKWLGEQAIIASGCRYLIIRTSWLHSPYRENFLKTMLHLGKEKKLLSIVCDQIGSPTSAAMLATATLQAIEQVSVNPTLCGLYHVVAAGETSWYDYACFIFAEARVLGIELTLSEIKPVNSHTYSSIATRPLNSRLDTEKFRSAFGIELPGWRDGVRDTLRQLIE